MELATFFDKVEDCEDLNGIGIDIKKGLLTVEYTPTSLLTTIPAGVVPEVEWDTLFDVLSGKREASVLKHMTRVVGYYSNIENWNKSKLGELKDRQKGTYTVEEAHA